MFTTSFRRKILFLLFAMLLAMPWAVSSASIPPTKEGCGIDPSGCPLPKSHRPTKAGCNIDPSGCASWNLPSTKEGCNIDPNGCTSQNPRPQQKEGCNIDPDGRCLH